MNKNLLNTQYSIPNTNSLVELLRWRADNQPDKTAFVFLEEGEREGGKFTYKELDIRAKSIAAKLQSLNLKDERALLIYESGLEYLDSFFGCLYAGVISVPLHLPGKNKSLSRISAIAKDSGAKVILSINEISYELKNEFAKDEVLKNLAWIETELISDSESANWKDSNVTADTLAYLQYTSGSTGIPKGVMVNHRNLLTNLFIIDKSHPHNENSVMVTWLPIHHDMGLIYGILLPFFGGYPCYFMTPQAFVQKPFRWLNAISKYKGTHNAAPNFAFELCVNKITEEQKKTLNLSSWTVAMNAAEPVRAETIERFVEYFETCGFKLKYFCPGYGLAEGTLILSTTFTDNEPAMKRFDDGSIEKSNIAVDAKPDDKISKVHVGHSNSIEDTRIEIVNPTTLVVCKEGEIGEVWASGISIAQGYWQREDATNETFKAHTAGTNEGPFMRTGDLGFIRDNELYITGRHKDLIIIRGQNHYPQDIEYTVEASHPALRLGCVAAFSIDIDGEEHLSIVQEVQKNFINDFDIEEVVRAIRKAVSEEHDLQVYSITLIKPQSVPKTSSGKIQRRACHNGVLDGTLEVIAQWKNSEILDFRSSILDLKNKTIGRSISNINESKFALTKNNLRAWLVNRLSEMMQIKKESIDVTEPFAVYGMDSLKAVQLSGDLETFLNKELPATLVYDYPNINSLTNYLTAETADSTAETADSYDYADGADTKKVGENDFVNEPIAIVGIGLRFPGAKNVNEFWINLKNGKDAISKIPEGRWDKNSLNESTVTFGGFVDDVDKFDPVFFGISPREAIQIDPQQRFTLEVAWEALEDAGINPDTLSGKEVGVFMGVCTYDYARYSSGRKELFDVYTGTGTSLSIVANRLSYFFDFRGQSVAIDTACSSSLVALHTACQSLNSSQSGLALAGGVNLLLAPDWNIVFTEADMLAPDGHCKTFDADADGYVRSEGCGIVVLKKLSDAERDGDRVYSVIKGSAINQDGRSNGLTAPNGPSQVAVVKSALSNANVEPKEISYIETHGTGTPLGDPIEVNSLKEALNINRSEENTLWLGSVKTNIGHLEAAAGIAGVIKTSLAIYNKEIPKHLNFNKLNPEILIEGTPLKIADQNIKWGGGKRVAGISSFGFGGTNAHVILQNAVELKQNTAKIKPFNLFTLGAKNEKVLNEYAKNYIDFLSSNDELKIDNVCYSANLRAPHNTRLAAVCSDINDLKKELNNFIDGKKSFDIISGTTKLNHNPKVAFLFPGQGAQYIGMGKELYDTNPLFRKTINRCDEILRDYLDKSLLEVLFFEKDENINPINETTYTQPALFAIEFALAQLWMSWGVSPAVMMGHSAGEYVAACLAGVFSLEDGLKLVTERGRLMETLTSNGEMYTIFANEQNVKDAIKDFEDSVSVASINSPLKTVISGNKDSLARILPSFDATQTEYKKINVSIASHSPLMNSMIDEFRKVCNTVKYSIPEIPVISNITGEIVTGKISNADYWCDHILSSVRFSEGIRACVSYGIDTFIDLGPKPTSIGMAQETVIDTNITWLASIKKNFTIWETMLQGLGTLYVNGMDVDWKNLDKAYSHKIISLPPYPFQKQRYWIGEIKGSRPKPFQTYSSEGNINKLVGTKVETASQNEFIFNSIISNNNPSYLKDHIVFEKIVVPGASFAEIALSAGSEILKTGKLKISDLVMHSPIVFENDEAKNIQTILSKEGKNKFKFEIFTLTEYEDEASWMLHASGSLNSGEDRQTSQNERTIQNLEKIKSGFINRAENKLSVEVFYKSAEQIGVEYKKNFQAIKELYRDKDSALGLIRIDDKIFDKKYKIHPVLLDASFQTALSLLMNGNNSKAFIPVGIEKLELINKCPEEVWSYVRLNQVNKKSPASQGGKVHKVDIELLSTDGVVIAEIKSLQLKETAKEEFSFAKDEMGDWFYEVKWIEQNLNGDGDKGDFIPSTDELKNHVKASLSGNKLEEYKKGIDELGPISASYIVKALNDLGVKVEAGNKFSLRDLNIVNQHQKLFKRLMEILEKEGVLKSSGDNYEIIKLYNYENIDTDSLSNLVQAELTLLTKCGEKLSEVLRGKVNPLQLLFPNGDLKLATDLYQNSPGFEVMNSSIQKIIQDTVKNLPKGRKIKIFEIGAGTGSSSSYILSKLSKEYAEYIFTDISPTFFVKAKDKLKEYDFVDYKILNIEKDPVVQGFAEHDYDIVIASNVVHATKDLSTTVKNILKLLLPNGLLILIEVTEKQNWIDLTFGLTEGWWRFNDNSLRPSYPLLTNDKWKRFLKEEGFDPVKIYTPENKHGESSTGQSMILAKAPVNVSNNISGKHLMFFADKQSGKKISKYLKSLKQDYTLIIEDDKYEKLSYNEFKMNANDKNDYKNLLKEISKRIKDEVKIIHINSHKDSIKDEDVEKLSQASCFNILNIIQAIPDSGFVKTPSLYLVTEDSQFVQEKDDLKGLINSPVWGMAKVISMEHPELRCRRIDIDSKSDYKKLIEEINSDSAEDQVAFRDSKRFVARLKRIYFKRENFITIDDKSSYLITGGLGGLGILTARWLAEKGARHLVLIGRRDNSNNVEEYLNEINSNGVEVKIYKADVTKKGDLEKVIKEIEKSEYPLKGVIHSVGVLDDAVLMNQSREKFDRVMSPKVLGAWYLHELTKKMKLDFFVMYSSVASLLGSAGQANHSSANAFLDALAYYRKVKSLAGKSINWGVWSQIGSAAARGADKQEKISGIGVINPQQGIRAMEKAIMIDTAQIGIVPIDWNKFNEVFRHPFINELISVNNKEEAGGKKDFISQIKNSPEGKHTELLTKYFQNLISGIMGMEPDELEVETPLNMMGLDSLMAIELKNKVNIELGVDLNLVRYMEETNILQLAEELKEQLPKILNKNSAVEKDNGKAELKQDGKTRDLLGKLDNLSEEELEQLLNELK